MINKILLLTILVLISFKPIITSAQTCEVKDIKYLSTYIDSRMWEVAGGNAAINLEVAQEMSSLGDKKIESATIYIPMLIKEIERYYADYNLDGSEKSILLEISKIFSKIWSNESFVISNESSEIEVCQKVNLIIDRYHQVSQDDSEFYKMIFTFDDGPFMGIDTDLELNKIKEISIDDKKLILRGNGSENTLEVKDKSGQLLWRKIISRSEEYKITNLVFADDPIRVNNELGYKIALYGDGELVQLYLRKNGAFRLFFHSW